MVKPGSRLDWCRKIYGELKACEKWGSGEKKGLISTCVCLGGSVQDVNMVTGGKTQRCGVLERNGLDRF